MGREALLVDSTDYIVDGLKGMLTPQRFEHSRGVEGETVRLAELYGADVQVCKIAGLLHDCARDMSYQDLLRTAEEHPGSAPEDCKNIPILLHSFVGAVVAKEKFGITDERILNSIRIHTLGDVDMTLEEKVVCLADYTEPTRNFAGVTLLRTLANSDLDDALLASFDSTIRHLINTRREINVRLLSARNALLRKITDRKSSYNRKRR